MGKAGQEHRDEVLSVLLDKRSSDKTWHTFDKISKRTKLNIREVMAVTGSAPYDIIGTRHGYKHVSRATKAEVREALSYLDGKVFAMNTRAHALSAHA